MADFNQSPSSQPTLSVSVSSIQIQPGAQSFEWFRSSLPYQLFSGGSVELPVIIDIGGSSGSPLPTVGQIWPIGR